MWLHSYCDLASFQGSWRTGKQDQGPRLPGRRAKPWSLGAGPWVSSPTEGQPSPRTSGNTPESLCKQEAWPTLPRPRALLLQPQGLAGPGL